MKNLSITFFYPEYHSLTLYVCWMKIIYTILCYDTILRNLIKVFSSSYVEYTGRLPLTFSSSK